jgi:uncharacterized membrane protein
MAKSQQTANPQGPSDRLKSEVSGLVGALANRAVSVVRDRIVQTAGRLNDYVADGGGPGLVAAVTGATDMAEGKGPIRSMLGAGVKAVTEKFRGKHGGGKGKLKVVNIIESIDVGVPVTVAYNQWTQFGDFPGFMKKVESVESGDEGQQLNWKAQVLWSHRTWEATIVDQRPDERIVWRSKGAKGHVDGSVTFHELAPRLTRILVVLEYHPQGFFEHTGNIWRAQGRRVRLELKHFRRHVMSQTMLRPDSIEGWRGVIEDGKVVKDHESAMAEEQDSERGQDSDRYQDTDHGEEPGYEADDRYQDDDRDEADDGYEDDRDQHDEPYAEEDRDEEEDGHGQADRGRQRARRRAKAAATRGGSQ